MGYSSYNSTARADRATYMGYDNTTSVNFADTFTQQKERRAHDTMLPINIQKWREARDSAAHPNTIPIQLYLDVTGSMTGIPIYMVREGLPALISKLIEAGLPDVALMFGAIGDHESDNYPLQLGQFESGDAELDMWLTRTYLEGNGGGNGGESYGLAWWNAINNIQTDQWEKRKRKGFVITIGDEPILPNYPASALKELYGKNIPAEMKSNYTAQELYDAACKQNHVLHIHIRHGNSKTDLKKIMGENCYEVNNQDEVVPLLIDRIVKLSKLEAYVEDAPNVQQPVSNSEEMKITL